MTKVLCFADTLVSVKCNKHLKHCHFVFVYNIATALDESLITNTALGFTSSYICHSTVTSRCIFHTNQPQYFKQYVKCSRLN